jgi:6-phosphogluconate dehydrogenase
MIMVKAGGPVDAVIEQLIPLLDKGDIIIDGGNSLYTDTERRDQWLGDLGLRFIGAGVSGGEEGARKGPSIMPGGPASTWDVMKPIFESISAKVDGEPCVTHIGPGGAGHYVKMIHNGIEYGDMQLICEAYNIFKAAGFSAAELGSVFSDWYAGDLESYLIQITAEIFKQVDAETGKPTPPDKRAPANGRS